MKFKKNLLFKISFTLLTIILLVACSSNINESNENATESSEKKITIRVGQTGWNSEHELLKAAGLDKDLPYNVEYSVFQGGNLILEAMNAGHVDLGTTSEIPPIFSVLGENGDKSKAIAIRQEGPVNQELVVLNDSPIKSVKDLKGKKVAYVQNTTAQYFLIKMLEEAGLTWNDIEAKQLSTADGLTALMGGNVDALASYGNSIISAKENGARTLASAENILSGNFLYMANTDTLADEQKRAAIADYIYRLEQAIEWRRNNLEEYAKIYAENTKQPYETALETLKLGEELIPAKIVPITDDSIASQQDIYNTFKSVGLFTEDFDVSTIWERSFNEDLEKVRK